MQGEPYNVLERIDHRRVAIPTLESKVANVYIVLPPQLRRDSPSIMARTAIRLIDTGPIGTIGNVSSGEFTVAIRVAALPRISIPGRMPPLVGDTAPDNLGNRVESKVTGIGNIRVRTMTIAASESAGDSIPRHMRRMRTNTDKRSRIIAAQIFRRRTGLIVHATVTMGA